MRKWLNTPVGRRIEHLLVAFLSTFAVTLIFNSQHILAEHGLDALKSALPALLVTAALAGWQQIRGSLPKEVVVEIEKIVKARKKAVPKP